MEILDLIIVGAGPAGYTASIYSSRYKINHMIIGMMPGGTITSAHKVCNYPGFDDISGVDLMMKMRKGALDYGVEEVMAKVVNVKRQDNVFLVELENGQSFKSRSVLIAIGTKRRSLGIDSEKKFEGKGLTYCSTCDGMLYKGKVVGVVGGANAATMSAIYLADIAERVYLIYRGDSLRGDKLWIDEVLSKKNVELILNSNVVELLGNNLLEGVRLDTSNRILDLNGLFLEIGAVSALDFDLGVDLTEHGYIVVDEGQGTSVDGIYAAGDITTGSNSFHQVVTACSEGAIASNSIYYYLKSL